MKNSFLSLVCYFCIGIVVSTAQTGEVSIFPKEKVYLHTDRTAYGCGETIYYSIYLTEEGQDEKTKLSEVLYVELIDESGEKLVSQRHKIYQGRSYGSLSIPVNLPTQKSTLRAYTNYMRNFSAETFYRSEIKIHCIDGPSESNERTEDNITLSVLPEGGHLIANMECRVAFKIDGISPLGQRKPLEIVNSKGDKALIYPNKYGMAVAEINIKSDQDYYAQYDGVKAYFPKAKKVGVYIEAKTTEDEILIRTTTKNKEFSSFQLLVMHGSTILEEKSLSRETIRLDKREMPAGIIVLAVVDQDYRPVAERIVFNHYGINESYMDVATDPADPTTRTEITTFLEFYDEEGFPIEGDFSVSVVDHRFHQEYLGIVAQYLLQSEVKGRIVDPDQYLVENTEEIIAKTDTLLLTQGWRSYSLDTDGLRYKKEQKLSLSGRTMREDKEKSVQVSGSMAILSEEFDMRSFETDQDGYFTIDDIEIYGMRDLFFQVGSKKKSKKDVKGGAALKKYAGIDIVLDNPQTHPVEDIDLSHHQYHKEENKKQSTPNLYEAPQDVAPDDWYVDESLLLSEVTITEQKIDKWVEYYDDVITYRPSNRIFTDKGRPIESYENIYNLLRGTVTGIEIAPSLDGLSQNSVIIRGRNTGLVEATKANNGAKFLLNGQVISPSAAESIRPIDIAFVDVIKSLSELTKYGELGSGGIIAIYLKPPGERSRTSENKKKNDGIYNTYMGYAEAKNFYRVDYAADGTYEKDQLRRTVHWEPMVKTNTEGIAYLRFYTADYIGSYYINVEGLTKDGQPISITEKIVVE